MELLQELVFAAFIAVLFSFLVAKLVSFAMSGGVGGGGHDSNSAFEVNDLDEGVIMEKLQFGENLNVGLFESESRVRLVEETVEKVEKFQEGVQRGEEIAVSVSRKEEIETERYQLLDKLIEVSGPCEESSEEKIMEKEAQKGEDFVEETFENEDSAVNNNVIIEESAVNNTVIIEELAVNDDVIIKESDVNNNDIVIESDVSNNVIGVESAVNNKVFIEESGEIGETSGGLVTEEDDEWEGIERSELEKVFGKAAKFLGSREKDDLFSDVQMELYGLHKIATEGPCHEPQPMALMVSARAKWNAWQRLGNMSQEEAMEQYVKLLSDRVPGWTEEHCCGDSKLESHEAGKPDDHQTNSTHERNLESNCDSEAGDLTGSLSLETKAKEC